jgi:hypothetical protein
MTPNQTLVAFGNVLKKITLSLFLVVACNAFAQVGVGTQTPVTTLDVSVGATPTNLATGNGITVPSVTEASTTAVAGTNEGHMVYDTTQKAFYYWNAGTSAWTAVGGGGGPDFTLGSGGILDVDVIATPDLSANTANNVLNITESGAGPGSTNITLPTPATNAGRIIVIINGGAKGINVLGAPAGIVASSLSGTFFCTGVQWVKSGN